MKIVVLGSLNIDLIFPLERLPKVGETLPGGDLALVPGGKGANQACAAGRLGAPVLMSGLLGRDAFAPVLRASLEAAGVDIEDVGSVDGATGAAGIFVLAKGDNAIVLSAGANGGIQPGMVPERLHRLSAGDYLLMQLEIPLDSTLAALELAKSRRAITVLDPAPARELAVDFYRLADWLTPNQTEAACLLGKSKMEIASWTDARDAAEQLLARGCGGVIVKLGAMGCFVATARICEAVPARRVDAVDTTAAGDAFNGAFASALLEGRDAVAAARFGCAAATVSVTRKGAQPSLPNRAEVEAFLRED